MRLPVLSIGTLLLLGTSLALAEDRRIDGAVRAVNAGKSSITVTTKTAGKEQDETLDVLKKAKVTVNGQSAALADVRKGQMATLTFNSELEVVTKIDATGEGVADPELAILKELPNLEAYQGAPWLSDDGLTLYWKAPPAGDKQLWIWSARRKSKDDLFEEAKRLVPGNDPTVTADGLEMILLDKDSLYATTRASTEAAFQRPQKIAEFQGLGFLAAPCMSGDGLTLCAERIDFKEKTVEFVEFKRSSRRAKWSQPQTMKFSGLDDAKLRFLYVTPDSTAAFCTRQVEGEQSAIVIFRAVPKRAGFHFAGFVSLGGEKVRGKFPRYIPATRELFFARSREDSQQDEICVIRNFDSEAHVAALDAVIEKRSPRQALQGEWLTIAEETNGKSASKSDVKQINRRIVVKGNALTMSRVMGGRSGTYTGTFEIDADSKTFDWTGKGPNGSPVALRGIYSLEGDGLKLCYKYAKDSATTRPEAFKTDDKAGTNFVFLILKRDKS